MFISYILALLLSVALTKIYLLDEKTQKELKGLIIFKRLYTGFNPNRSLESLTDFVRLLSRCADVSSKA